MQGHLWSTSLVWRNRRGAEFKYIKYCSKHRDDRPSKSASFETLKSGWVSIVNFQLDSSEVVWEETCKLDTFLEEISSGEKTVSEGAELSTSVKPMDDLSQSKSGKSQTKLNKTDLPTSGDDGHVARWVAHLEQHLPTDVDCGVSFFTKEASRFLYSQWRF